MAARAPASAPRASAPASTTCAPHVSTTRAPHVSTTRAPHVSTTRAPHVSTTRAPHVSATRAPHVSTTCAPHVSNGQGVGAEAASRGRADICGALSRDPRRPGCPKPRRPRRYVQLHKACPRVPRRHVLLVQLLKQLLGGCSWCLRWMGATSWFMQGWRRWPTCMSK